MKVLIGCEFSGKMREAFRRRGHDAWSNDLLPAADGSPHHLQCDVLSVLDDGWDMAIFHPPCTYLTSSGLHWNVRGRLVDGRPRAELTDEALEFVTKLWRSPIPRKALENPRGCINTRLAFMPEPQVIQPHYFGEDASKTTCIWLDNLPPLRPTQRVNGRWVLQGMNYVERWANQTDSGQNRLGPSDTRWAERSETYRGIAEAAADQWGALPEESERVA